MLPISPHAMVPVVGVNGSAHGTLVLVSSTERQPFLVCAPRARPLKHQAWHARIVRLHQRAALASSSRALTIREVQPHANDECSHDAGLLEGGNASAARGFGHRLAH